MQKELPSFLLWYFLFANTGSDLSSPDAMTTSLVQAQLFHSHSLRVSRAPSNSCDLILDSTVLTARGHQ